MNIKNTITKGRKVTSALKQKRHIERIVVDKIKFQGKKENFKKQNSNWILNQERELNVDKKIFLTQSEIVRLKELIRDLNHIYPEALRKNGLMEWCNKVLEIKVNNELNVNPETKVKVIKFPNDICSFFDVNK